LFFDNKSFNVDSCASVDEMTIYDKKKLGAGSLENAFLSVEKPETIMFQGCIFLQETTVLILIKAHFKFETCLDFTIA